MEQKEHKGLSPTAYEAIPGDEYKPYIPAEQSVPEATVLSIALGILLAVGFGIAMVYVGLKIGMTISASVPAAVISMGILKGIFRRGSILENNLVQTIGSAGESLAAGIIFTIPAAYLWQDQGFDISSLSVVKLTLIALIGGALGVLMMIPLRKYLIVHEHGILKFPEGTACAEVLVAGDMGGNPAKLVFSGMMIGAVYKFGQQFLKLWKGIVHWELPGMKNLVFSAESSPILLSVGYIIGLRVSALMFSGGLLAWFVIIPMITYFGANVAQPVFPGQVPINTMDADTIWNVYIRYVGAGAVAFGGLISLMKAFPTIMKSFSLAFTEFIESLKHMKEGTTKHVKRTQQDIPMIWVLGGSILLILAIAFTRIISNSLMMGIVGAVLVFIFGFFFVTVSSRIVGIVGSSSNPISGMTIGTLIASTLIFRALGFRGLEGMITSLLVGAFVCVAMGLAGDVSQDLKTGFLVGATPRWQQIGQIIGIAASSFFIIQILIFLEKNIGFTGPNALKAPQANIMNLLIRGIMEGNLPWTLILCGGFIAICIELLGISALPFAVGLYLPLELSTPLMIGGGLAWLTSRLFKKEEFKEKNEKGVLVSSGLIAGDALMGILVVAIVAFLRTDSAKNIVAFLQARGFDFETGILWSGYHWFWPAVVMILLVGDYMWFNIRFEHISDAWRQFTGYLSKVRTIKERAVIGARIFISMLACLFIMIKMTTIYIPISAFFAILIVLVLEFHIWFFSAGDKAGDKNEKAAPEG